MLSLCQPGQGLPGLFDANVVCVKEETRAFADFKAIRSKETRKAKKLGEDDWCARKQVRQEKRAEEKRDGGRP